MPNVPPDPRAVINDRIHHFKKQSQKLNLEFIEAEMELERAKEAVRKNRQAQAMAPTAIPRAVAPVVPKAVMTIQPFANGVGYALRIDGKDLWFDSEIHAINYAQDLYPHCEVAVLNSDGTVRHHYSAAIGTRETLPQSAS
jgi:hypothetical protein